MLKDLKKIVVKIEKVNGNKKVVCQRSQCRTTLKRQDC
jgi:hypothetical protein